MPSLPEETKLDHPLYGEFEDYLDGVLPAARRREVEDLLARSAVARAALEELRTARAWLHGTDWEVPEPAEWPSAEAILARAGRRPAAAGSAVKRWWSDWRASWRFAFRSPAWALGAAACLALLVGGSLWWMFRPSASDEVAQSRRPQPPARVEPAGGPVAPAAPAAPPSAERTPVERAPNDTPKRKDAPEKPRVDAAQPTPAAVAPEAPLERTSRPPAVLGQAEPAPSPAAAPSSAGVAEGMRLRTGRDLARQSKSPASAPAGASSALPEAHKEDQEEAADAYAPAAPHAWKPDESAAARAGSSSAEAENTAPVTLRLVVADRARAIGQATAVARAFGGTVRVGGERVVVVVPAARVTECAAQIRARVSTAVEGWVLEITVRARE
ncbi:MAG: hypothetical protein NZ585_04405 [Chloracidobacterium sp.]|nr:hypothetical protein [Chloracidobacterium sp.]MDW8218595.1 hypothetical protein [Acidobacteriota bacterium]